VRPRGVAAITAVVFAVCGMLAMRHEAATPHVRGGAGAFVHASELSGHHTGHHSDIHGERVPGADTGECALLTACHQPVSADISVPVVVAAALVPWSHGSPRSDARSVGCAVYRLAPKTSPPVV
jgi:hypothetical protein